MSGTRPTAVNGSGSLIGRLLGPYRVESLLGRGGMSAVYRATQTTLDRPVALKLLPVDFASDQTLVSRFLQEARAAAALQHPHIIPIYDSGQVDGLYYIAMRYIEGVPLSRAIPDTGFPLPRAAAIVEQLAAALDYAHARGVIHRDVSAGNVMLEPGDRVTLMDFGIAQARQSSRLTRAGIAVGTLEYLSPEQARGELATPRSDVYALGVLTYELLTGTLPFSAAEDRALLLQHLNTSPPSLRALRPEIPAGVDAAIQRCLAKDPRARFASAGAFAAALQDAVAERGRRTAAAPAPAPARPARVVSQPPPAAPPPRPQNGSAPRQPKPPVQQAPAPRGTARPAATRVRHRRRWLWPLAGVVLLGLALAGGAYAQRGSGPRGLVSFSPTAVGSGHGVAASSASSSSRSGTATASSRSAASTTPTPPALVAVSPHSPGEAVQGYYDAVNGALAGGDPTRMALAYSYLTPQARAQLPYPSFLNSFKDDQSVGWHWYPPTQQDQKSATVPVTLTEFRSSGSVTSSLLWTVLNDGSGGWHLDHVQQQAQQAAPVVPVVAGKGHGHGKHGEGD